MPVYFTDKGVKAEVPLEFYPRRKLKTLCAECERKDKVISELKQSLSDALHSLEQYRQTAKGETHD